jgi:hypothetical protein
LVLPSNNTERIFRQADMVAFIALRLNVPMEMAPHVSLDWKAQRLGWVHEPVFPYMMTMRQGAGFYSHFFGPLPFALTRVPNESYEVIELLEDARTKSAGVEPQQP